MYKEHLYLLRSAMRRGHNKAYGHIVRAASEQEARQLASREAGDEGAIVWLEDRLSSCTPLHYAGEHAVIMTDYLAG